MELLGERLLLPQLRARRLRRAPVGDLDVRVAAPLAQRLVERVRRPVGLPQLEQLAPPRHALGEAVGVRDDGRLERDIRCPGS